ncbi:MAG TPA: hypothetical protein VNQ76_12140 [Planctomicrobium sp.]|nr:hypothetical protein [Planctomicrobium sp.]
MKRNPGILSDVVSATLESLVVAQSSQSLHPHLRRQVLTAACDLLDNALKNQHVPVYPSSCGGVDRKPLLTKRESFCESRGPQ